MKHILLSLLMVFIAACSDKMEFFPNDKASSSASSSESVPTPVIATPEELKKPIIVDDGLVIVSTGDSTTGTIEIRKSDPAKDLIITVELEKGEEIQLKNPDEAGRSHKWDSEIEKIEVIYKPKEGEIAQDNLRITYVNPNNKEENGTIIYPIRGKKEKPVVVKEEPKKEEPKVEPVVVKEEPKKEEVKKEEEGKEEVVITPKEEPIVTTLEPVDVIKEKPVLPQIPEIKPDPKQDRKKTEITITTLSKDGIIDLGKVPEGKKVEVPVTITNSGKIEAQISIENKKPELFQINAEDCSTPVKPGKECTILITAENEKVGIIEGEIIISHNSKDEGEIQQIKVPILIESIKEIKPVKEGMLIASEVFGSDVNFGSVALGREVHKQVEIQNKGEQSLKISLTQFEGDSAFAYTGGKFPGKQGSCSEVLIKGSCMLDLTFKPRAIGDQAGNLNLKTEEGPSLNLKLAGSGSELKNCDSFNEYLVAPLKSHPYQQVIFPYLPNHSSTTAKLSYLYGMQVNSFVPELKNYTVKDGQVYVTFMLPKIEGEIVNMSFGVNVYKIIRDNFKDTEALCLSTKKTRKCSGHEFSLAAWQKLKNPAFWNLQKKPMNELYEKQLESNENKCGSKNCMALNTTYELKDIFELTPLEFNGIREESLFTLVFSDDTRLETMPRIYVKTKITQACQ